MIGGAPLGWFSVSITACSLWVSGAVASSKIRMGGFFRNTGRCQALLLPAGELHPPLDLGVIALGHLRMKSWALASPGGLHGLLGRGRACRRDVFHHRSSEQKRLLPHHAGCRRRLRVTFRMLTRRTDVLRWPRKIGDQETEGCFADAGTPHDGDGFPAGPGGLPCAALLLLLAVAEGRSQGHRPRDTSSSTAPSCPGYPAPAPGSPGSGSTRPGTPELLHHKGQLGHRPVRYAAYKMKISKLPPRWAIQASCHHDTS